MLDTNYKSIRHFTYLNKFLFIVPTIIIFLFFISLVSLSSGAVSTTYNETFEYLLNFILNSSEIDPVKEKVISNIRFPRIILSILVGASLAVSGASLQGIFKNPMADPGIIGVSSGAAEALF